MKNIETDVIVIGAGPGGYPAAFHCADKGKKVILVDPEVNPGGVCLYRGCIPSKALLHAAKVIHDADDAKSFGVEFSKPKIYPDKLFGWKDKVVKKLTGGLKSLTKSRNIEYIQGYGEFSSRNTLRVNPEKGEKQEIKFKYAVIATGSVPRKIPGVEFSDNVLNSKTALSLGAVPGSMLIVGGGYIGLELGTVYSSLGTEITVVEMLPELVQGADNDLVSVLQKKLKKEFNSIKLNTKVNKINDKGKNVEVELEDKNGKTKHTFDKVLISIGRKPVTDTINIQNTNIKIKENGFIEVDNQRRTSDNNIFAIGDVAGNPMLAHKATYEGKLVAEVISGEKSVYDPAAVPAVMFTDPEIAWCGMTEQQAKDNGLEIEIAKFPWGASGRALTLNRTDGLTKLIIDKNTRRLLGVGIVGSGAGELISEGVMAIEMAANAEDIAHTIHPHPTLTETIMEAAESIFGSSTHMYKPKK